jgi:large conductance mechanosensitive channel
MWKEFRTFIERGNVVELAVAFILGAAFGRVVTSLVDDIIMPPIGLVLGRVDFTNLFVSLSGQSYPSLAAAKAAGAATINYGVFVNTIITFLIVAFALFLVIRSYNSMKRREEGVAPSEPVTKNCPFCFSPIPLKATRCPDCTSELNI